MADYGVELAWEVLWTHWTLVQAIPEPHLTAMASPPDWPPCLPSPHPTHSLLNTVALGALAFIQLQSPSPPLSPKALPALPSPSEGNTHIPSLPLLTPSPFLGAWRSLHLLCPLAATCLDLKAI